MTHAASQKGWRRRLIVWLTATAGGACLAMGFQPEAQPAQPEPVPAPVELVDEVAEPEPETEQGAEEQEAEIILRDGKRISGTLVSRTNEKVVVSIAGIATSFPMDTVDNVRVLPPVQERYEVLRSTIDPQDVDGSLRLAEWVRSKGRLDLALLEVENVLKLEPANPAARDLRTLVLAQMDIAEKKVASRQSKGLPAPKAAPFPLLNKDQINLIRVFEVDVKNPPRLLIQRDTIMRFMDKYKGATVEGKGSIPSNPAGRELFLRLQPVEILAWMFDLRAREFYPEVTVQDNPKAFQMFRDRINRNWLVNSCATNKCHGGEDAGRLWLYNRQQASDPAAYTNFLILERFKLANGQALINYNDPAGSPLLQMGLPRDQAEIKHPEVAGRGRGQWTPTFRSKEDDRFTGAVDWINSMYPKRPDYPIDYKVPVPNPKRPQGLGPDGQPVDR